MQPRISSLHAAARRYAEVGIPVFPCLAGDKVPATENGFHDATTDTAQIDAWWGQNPNYNLAFCPASAGLFVIDIDPGAPDDIRKNLPGTYCVRTPRNGYHLYYDGIGPSTVGKLATHVDTRSTGGYVLVPPSRVSAGAYVLEVDADYAPAPAWVLEKLTELDTPIAAATEELDLPGNIERAAKILKRHVEKGDVAIEGQGGDDRTFRICCEMLDLGLSAYTAQNLLEDIWNPHCMPPWMPEELELKLENAYAYRQNDVGAYAVDAPAKVFSDIVKNLPSTQEPLSRFHFKSEEEVDEEKDPEWIIKDLISEQSTVMLYGASGSYKSFLALDIALSVASGVCAFGSETKAGLVFYAALEGKAHLKKARRAWKVLKDVGKVENFFTGIAPMIGLDGEMQQFGDEIKKRCDGKPPRLIIIDTLSKSMAGLNENDAQDAGKFIRFCDSLVEAFRCTVIAIHHTGKEEGRGARGSSAFFAGFDTVLEVKAWKNTKAVAVHVRKHKDAEERELPWTFEGRITGPSLTFEATTQEQHKLLIGEGKDITPKIVGAMLKQLDAFGEEAAVTTAVLATELTPGRESESVDQRADNIARTVRVLTGLAGNKLEAYCVKQRKGYIWHLPAPVVSG